MYRNQNFYCNDAQFPIENIVRYWIWWNDLPQGPFEIDELTSLNAFCEDMLVCMEGRLEWIPAGRVADLSSAIEQVRAKRTAPKAPPPSPPRRPPIATPLQGEFFGEAPAQQYLLKPDDQERGPYAFYPVTSEPSEDGWAYRYPGVTMPIHFARQPSAAPAVLDLPHPAPAPERITVVPVPIIKESPAPKIAEVQPVPKKENLKTPIPLSVVETTPEPRAVQESPVFVLPPSQAPTFDEPRPQEKRIRWALWVLTPVLALGALGGLAYYMDRATSEEAIEETLRERETRPPIPAVIPTVPAPPPSPTKKAAPVVVRPSQKPRKATARKVKAVPPPPVKTATPVSAPAVQAPVVAPAPPLPGVAASPPVEEAKVAPDLWAERQNDAIETVMNKSIPGSKTSIKAQARAMLDAMHQRELLHAAKTGERLYLPDKISWAALREEGSQYRVYLNFMAWQAGGERVQARSYQFRVDLKNKNIRPEDASTFQDLFQPSPDLNLKHDPMALDIESILGGVDHFNKQRMRAIIVKNSRKNKTEYSDIMSSLSAAKDKIHRAAAFFRKTYSDEALRNVAKAYQFTELLKG